MKLPFGLQLGQKAWRKNPHRKRVTAVYVEGNSIIIGSNSRKTHPLALEYGHRMQHTHAEVSVLSKVDDASKGVLYIYRETQAGELAMSRPCEFCMPLLIAKNVKKIVYTTSLGFAKEKILANNT